MHDDMQEEEKEHDAATSTAIITHKKPNGRPPNGRPSWNVEIRAAKAKKSRMIRYINTKSRDRWVTLVRELLPFHSTQQISALYTLALSQRSTPEMCRTYPDEVKALCDRFHRAPEVVVDVCRGSGGISETLQTIWTSSRHFTMDIDPQWNPTFVADFLNPSTYSHLPVRMAQAAIFSPPFELADAFLAMALRRTRSRLGLIAMHIPANYPDTKSVALNLILEPYVNQGLVARVSLALLPNYRAKIGKCHWLVVFHTHDGMRAAGFSSDGRRSSSGETSLKSLS